MNAEEYVKTLENILIPNARRIYPREVYSTVKIVHDNSAVHTLQLVQTWFDVNPDFIQIVWSAKSSDLNPIENV